jgi:hypothetical protein
MSCLKGGAGGQGAGEREGHFDGQGVMSAEGTAGQVGPGSMRVGQFIGRLGVVGLPAVAMGLGLAERVVRRHVARLDSLAKPVCGDPWRRIAALAHTTLGLEIHP